MQGGSSLDASASDAYGRHLTLTEWTNSCEFVKSWYEGGWETLFTYLKICEDLKTAYATVECRVGERILIATEQRLGIFMIHMRKPKQIQLGSNITGPGCVVITLTQMPLVYHTGLLSRQSGQELPFYLLLELGHIRRPGYLIKVVLVRSLYRLKGKYL